MICQVGSSNLSRFAKQWDQSILKAQHYNTREFKVPTISNQVCKPCNKNLMIENNAQIVAGYSQTKQHQGISLSVTETKADSWRTLGQRKFQGTGILQSRLHQLRVQIRMEYRLALHFQKLFMAFGLREPIQLSKYDDAKHVNYFRFVKLNDVVLVK